MSVRIHHGLVDDVLLDGCAEAMTPKGPSSGNGSEEARRRGEIAFEISQALVEELPRLVDQITTRVTTAISERERFRTSVRYPRFVMS